MCIDNQRDGKTTDVTIKKILALVSVVIRSFTLIIADAVMETVNACCNAKKNILFQK